ncbi:glucosyltransferase, partial [Methylobacterium aquaticum]
MEWTWISTPLLVLALAGCIYGLTTAWLAGRLARRPAPRLSAGAARPSVTLLKPLCGDEPNLHHNLTTFCAQAYAGAVQVIFGVQNAADPAIAVVH